MSTVSNSPRLARCARPASPTYSLPCWEICREISRVIRPASYKEQRDEYSIQRRPRVLRAAGIRARGHVGDSAHVVVGTTGIEGIPFDLSRPAGPRQPRPGRLSDCHAWPRHVDQPGAGTHGTRTTLHLRCVSDHGSRVYCRVVLLTRRPERL